jgi:hypothetical protein
LKLPDVEMVIELNDGRAVYGWAIWQVPGVYIEAEFHRTWKNDAAEPCCGVQSLQ